MDDSNRQAEEDRKMSLGVSATKNKQTNKPQVIKEC